MPSSSIRKKVYGLIRNTFSSISSDIDNDSDNDNNDDDGLIVDKNDKRIINYGTGATTTITSNNPCFPDDYSSLTQTSSNSFISQCIFKSRKNGMKYGTEIYSGKTGLDLPVLLLEPLSKNICASYTGPEGGLMEVGGIRRQPIVRMANLDDELYLSFDGNLSEIESSSNDEFETPQHNHLRQSSSGLIGSCTSLVDSLMGDAILHSDTEDYDWNCFDEERCFGISTTLYEQNPLTGVNAGNPIADAFGIVARENNVVMALADGVNWGEGARLAARCAIRGAIDHLNYHLFAEECGTTTDVFHRLLGAFHSAHALILQEGGLLTTLCVAVAVQLKESTTWVLCVCNVGDSLCFVYNPQTGVQEITIASHDICSMRDMRDAGGALGPVDGMNPQLHNLTYDVIFITSDGVSDNFDPVVGKFCVIKRPSEPVIPAEKLEPISVSVGSEDKSRDIEFARIRTCNASLPCVDAEERHELMLLRMGDIISNGILPSMSRLRSSPASRSQSPNTGGVVVSASKLCHNLIQFARQLSMAKRRTLEDPELYQIEKRLTKSEQRNHRKMVRCKLSEMPGKLDHATVVAFKVGIWPNDDDAGSERSLLADDCLNESASTIHCENDENEEKMDNVKTSGIGNIQEEEMTCDVNFAVQNDFIVHAQTSIPCSDREKTTANVDSSQCVNSSQFDSVRMNKGTRNRNHYEEISISNKANDIKTPKKHARGSAGRHTLSVDVAWLKKFVVLKNSTNGAIIEEERTKKFNSGAETERPQTLSLRQRFCNLMGSARGIIQTSAAGTPNRELPSRNPFSKKVSSTNSSPRKKPQAY
uniref:PPM-type phosphatase domain-containing protein n=1 Tax=Onchocerca volvulus TaxID=6282 RepID=A0A8R1XKP7_ONCVO